MVARNALYCGCCREKFNGEAHSHRPQNITVGRRGRLHCCIASDTVKLQLVIWRAGACLGCRMFWLFIGASSGGFECSGKRFGLLSCWLRLAALSPAASRPSVTPATTTVQIDCFAKSGAEAILLSPVTLLRPSWRSKRRMRFSSGGANETSGRRAPYAREGGAPKSVVARAPRTPGSHA
jgi:hypothetical protein